MNCWVGLGVIADNLLNIGSAMENHATHVEPLQNPSATRGRVLPCHGMTNRSRLYDGFLGAKI